ncbi:MAG: SGNH/GDSL hydrolase family protein [Candidatus Anammoximicrobium sp.]|nr:SGNH/GDSL hydrolase family protein [Candidatus Anammoximicrobium sp.]
MPTRRNWTCRGVLLGLLLGALVRDANAAEEYVHARAGLPNCPYKLQPGTWINTVFVGSTATFGQSAGNPGPSYHTEVMRYLRTTFPGSSGGAPVIAGGTGSWWAAFCAARGQAVYGQHLPGAIMFVEVATDDGDATEDQVCIAMEGLVRQLWTTYPSTDLVFLYGLRKDDLEAYKTGRLPPVVQWHERVAEHYGIPSVNMGQFVAQKILAGELTLEAFSKDGVHPTARGQTLYAEAVKPLIAHCKAAFRPEQAPPKRVLPSALSPAPMVKAQCVPYESAKLTGDWRVGQPSPAEPFRHVLVSDQPGATLTFQFKGMGCGIFEVIGPDTGDLELSMDGGDWQPCPNFDAGCFSGARSSSLRLAQGLDPDRWHEVQVRVAAKQPAGSQGRFVRIGCLLVDGEVADPYAGKTPLERLDAIYAAMDPLRYTPPVERWQRIPRAMQRLREGGNLKIVLLGDSIMNQTCHSGFGALLQRLYPKVKIESVASVRGSTGCWWYKEENRVEDYVLKHHPDLLMIGGISQRNDVDSIREVIRQVREKQQPEILLMTPAFGFEGSDFIREWTYDVKPAGNDYRARLLRLASEEGCEFLDMTGPWWQSVKDSGKTYGWFRGDAVHANERGTQILARIMERYFAPDR